ncbi:hypothetical protein J1N35_012248 [Gossypium stocksii]|uniref:RNase H type-1 domain-containing protein n=1 Tax=Gossypium stocksii TaxID=47602 RepID=A0A9D4AE44_9ROSI|nr:hypothetical protein J1N35_012248 [Gossypium stocksii]
MSWVGGLLRIEKDDVHVVFSQCVGFAIPCMAELMVVKEVFNYFFASKCCNSHKLVIESDSQKIVNWFLDPFETPNSFRIVVLVASRLGPNDRWLI